MIYGDNLQHYGIKGQKWGVIRTKMLRAMRRAKNKLKRKKTETGEDKGKGKNSNYKNGQYRNKRTRALSPTEKLRIQNDLKELIDNVNVSRRSAREAKEVYRNREDMDRVKATIKKLRAEADYNYELKRTNKNDVALAKTVGKVGVNTALKSQGLKNLANISDAAFRASDNTSRTQRRNTMVKAILEASANKYLDGVPGAHEARSKVTKEFKKAAKARAQRKNSGSKETVHVIKLEDLVDENMNIKQDKIDKLKNKVERVKKRRKRR